MEKNFWFIGTGNFAALCLENLLAKNLPITKIITGLPTRSGRNNKENPSPVELKASQLGRPVTRTGKLSENHELISALERENPAAIFVIDFGQIIREPFLSRMCLNIHPSLLPEYRGAAPIQRALLDGKNYTGVSVFRLVQDMDAGEILSQKRTEIFPNENASDLYVRLSEIGCEIACDALKNFPDLKFSQQENSLATFAPKITKEIFSLSFNMPAKKFCSTVRALDMSGGAYVIMNDKRVKIWRVNLREDLRASTPGEIISLENSPVISCEDFCVELLEIQTEGKKRMSARDWAAGLRVKEGAIL